MAESNSNPEPYAAPHAANPVEANADLRVDSQPEPDSKRRPDSKRGSGARRTAVVIVIAAALIGVAQWVAPQTDHQWANFGSAAIGLLAAIYAIVQFHRAAAAAGHLVRVPSVCLLLAVGFVSLFEFDGFSGEMLPQFQLRFGREPRLDIRQVGDVAAEAVEADAGMNNDSAVAAAPSPGFLSATRTGVISQRLFSVPRSEGDVVTLWNQGIGQGWSSFAVAGDRAVTLEQRDDLECVTCYRLSDGELLWIETHRARHEDGLGGIGPRSTPTIDGGRVYAQGATGRLWCIDLQSGDVVWTVDLLALAGWDQAGSETAIAWGRAGSPLLIDDSAGGERLCVVPYGGPEINAATGRSLIALDAESGDVRWTAGQDQISFASPALMTLSGVRQIVSVNEKTVTGHQPADGTRLWSIDWPGSSSANANCATAMPAGKDRFLIGKGYAGGSALIEVSTNGNSLTANAIWESTRLLKTKFTHACVDRGIAFALSNGSLEAVRIEDRQRLWQQPRGSRFQQGQILLVEDIIVVQSESGEIAFVAADENEYRELIRIPAMDSKTWNIPAIAGRHLLVRNDRQAICFLLPERD